jgi:trans-2,3-dihydro-3-hydroxyanthranilate isomerase
MEQSQTQHIQLQTGLRETMVRQYQVSYVDAFTRCPFAGNPCAVLPDAVGLTDEEMQAIAHEVNLPETAFVLPSSRADFRVRYFTPRTEIPFAGHPTIAVGFVLAQDGLISLQEPVTRIYVESQVAVLPVEIYIDGGELMGVEMTQQQPVFGEVFTGDEVAHCLGLSVSELRSDCPSQVVGTGVPFLIVPVRQVDVLGHVCMDRGRLAALCNRAGVTAAFAFSIGGFDPEADTHARLFDPEGAMEDPFTGSATGAMGAYVVYYGLRPGPRLVAEQGHFVGRPGLGTLEIGMGEGRIEAVKLKGAAVRTLIGTLLIPEASSSKK